MRKLMVALFFILGAVAAQAQEVNKPVVWDQPSARNWFMCKDVDAALQVLHAARITGRKASVEMFKMNVAEDRCGVWMRVITPTRIIDRAVPKDGMPVGSGMEVTVIEGFDQDGNTWFVLNGNKTEGFAGL